MRRASERKLTITFDLDGNHETPALVDLSERELTLLSRLMDMIEKFPAEYRLPR